MFHLRHSQDDLNIFILFLFLSHHFLSSSIIVLKIFFRSRNESDINYLFNLLIKSSNRVLFNSIFIQRKSLHYIKSCIYIFFFYYFYLIRNNIEIRSTEIVSKEYTKGYSKRIISKKSSILTIFPIEFDIIPSFIILDRKVYSKYPDCSIDIMWDRKFGMSNE